MPKLKKKIGEMNTSMLNELKCEKSEYNVPICSEPKCILVASSRQAETISKSN